MVATTGETLRELSSYIESLDTLLVALIKLDLSGMGAAAVGWGVRLADGWLSPSASFPSRSRKSTARAILSSPAILVNCVAYLLSSVAYRRVCLGDH